MTLQVEIEHAKKPTNIAGFQWITHKTFDDARYAIAAKLLKHI